MEEDYYHSELKYIFIKKSFLSFEQSKTFLVIKSENITLIFIENGIREITSTKKKKKQEKRHTFALLKKAIYLFINFHENF